MHAMVEQKTCIQCGLCPSLCPQVFSLEPGEPAQAITEEIPVEWQVACQEAADNCPVDAIDIK